MKYIVRWITNDWKQSGHGRPVEEAVARAWCEAMNIRWRGKVYHWVEKVE